uniref:PAR14 polymerase n=1 Tax=Naja naja TaxID=35670 RepID=A0A8C6Y4Q1_NAJNA
MAEGRGMCAFPVLLKGAWESPDPPKILRNKILRYFQSPKKSGGGECEIQKQGRQILVFFAQEEVRQRVVSQKFHELDLAEKGILKLEVSLYETTDPAKDNEPKKEVLSKKAPHVEKDIVDCPQKSSQVVLENVEENINLDTLTLLVDNISALSGDSTFHIEPINEKKAAVVTFQQTADFLKQCSKNHRFQQYRLTARLLELTPVIKVENIPAETSCEFLTLYFESPKHGGGRVSDIQLLPREDSALFGHITRLGLVCG